MKNFEKENLEIWLKENYKKETDKGRKSSAYS